MPSTTNGESPTSNAYIPDNTPLDEFLSADPVIRDVNHHINGSTREDITLAIPYLNLYVRKSDQGRLLFFDEDQD